VTPVVNSEIGEDVAGYEKEARRGRLCGVCRRMAVLTENNPMMMISSATVITKKMAVPAVKVTNIFVNFMKTVTLFYNTLHSLKSNRLHCVHN
jgi:hypothetical protein